MKKHSSKTKILLVFSVLAILGLGAATAHADTTNTVLSPLITPGSPEDSTTIEQRLVARKAVFKIPPADLPGIAAKCTLAQSALVDRRTKDTKAASARLETYNELAKRLSFLIDNMSGQGNDASGLLAAENQFVSSINKYLAHAGAYRAAMDDAITLDCKADPAGFKASVLDARQNRAYLGPDVTAIKANLSGLRKALVDARQQLVVDPHKKAAVKS